MGTTEWSGLDYVCEALLTTLGADRAVLWVAGSDGVLTIVGAHGVDPAANADAFEALFGSETVGVQTPPAPAAPIAVLQAVGVDTATAQGLLDDAADALGIPALLEHAEQKGSLADGVLEAIADQAAILDTDGVIVQTNTAWTRTPVSHRRVVERSPVGSVYPDALRSQVSRPAKITAEGIEAVLKGALRCFQTDYDTEVDSGDRSYSVQVDPLPAGGAVVRHIDISFRKHLQRQLAHRATHDPLTGLPNRMVMNERLQQAMLRAARTGSGIALLFCDVDAFKQINDSLGHSVGDQVLTAVARRMQESVRQSDVVARFGGDEFVVLLEDVPDERFATRFAAALQSSATTPLMVDGRPVHFSLSIGISVHRGTVAPEQFEEILADADAAMYMAKRGGRGSIRVVEPRERNVDLAGTLDQVTTSLLIQPIVDLPTKQPTCYEACARLGLPDQRFLAPADFLQRAEETGSIVEIGRAVLTKALGFAAILGKEHVSVNVSWTELAQPDYPETVLSSLLGAGVDPRRLELEVLMPSSTSVIALAALRRLREAGVRITLDAFGRQPVELGVLPDLAVAGIKVDRALTAAAVTSERHARLVRGMVQLANHLGIVSTAEGIETPAQAALVETIGFRRAQGFHYGRPQQLAWPVA